MRDHARRGYSRRPWGLALARPPCKVDAGDHQRDPRDAFQVDRRTQRAEQAEMVDRRGADQLADEDEEDRVTDPEFRCDKGYRDHVKSDKQPKGMLVNNSFAKVIKAKKDIDAAEYLLFAKKCEKWEWMSIDEMREKINELSLLEENR